LRIKHNGHKYSEIDDEGPNKIAYIIPRVDDIVLGGTVDNNNYSTEIDKDEISKIIKRVEAMNPTFKNVERIEARVGLRACRDEIRVEVEYYNNDSKLLFHNYRLVVQVGH